MARERTVECLAGLIFGDVVQVRDGREGFQCMIMLACGMAEKGVNV